MSEARAVFRVKRLRPLALAAGVLVIAGAAGVYFAPPGEPTYGGKSLSWWLERYMQERAKVGYRDSSPAVEEAMDAVGAIGTNSIPTLLRWMGKPDSVFRYQANLLLSKQRLISFRFERPYKKWYLAHEGFRFLGNKAMCAIPTLTRIYESAPEYHQKGNAFQSILDIGLEKKLMLPVIVQALQRRDDLGRAAAYYVFLTHPEEGEKLGIYKVMPELRASTTNDVSTNAISQTK